MSKFLDWFLGKDLQQPSPQQSDGAKALTISSPLYSTITNYGWPWSSYSALYRTQPAIRTVVDFIARNIAGLNAKVYERNGNDRPEIEGHPLGLLLHNPNPFTTRFNHTYATIADKCIFDRAYWRKHYERGVLKGILRIPPSKIWPEYDKETGHVSYRLVTGEVLQRGRDLVVFSGYSPDGGDEGVPPLETLRRILAEDTAATTYRESFWKNQARPSGSIERPLDAPEWSEEARKRFRADFESTYAGAANAGKIPVMEEGMKLVSQSFSARDSELIESRKLTYEEVTRVYGLPFALIGAMSESKSNVESFHRQLYQDVLGPWLRFLQDEIELQLLPEFEKNEVRRRKIYVEYNLAEKLKGSFEEQGKMLVTAVGVPYMSANEARARLNLPSIDDEAFDEPVKPLNVMYGGQPAVTVPTEDPGTPPLAAVASVEDAARKVEGERKAELARTYEKGLRKFFTFQEQVIVSKLGASKSNGRSTVEAIFSSERWNQHLTSDLFTMAGHLEDQAVKLAERINDVTRIQLGNAVPELDDVRAVFTDAKDNRATAWACKLAGVDSLPLAPKHLPGEHDQDTHGGGEGGASDWSWGKDERRFSVEPPQSVQGASDAWSQSLTSEESSAVLSYTTGTYKDINDRLRTGEALSPEQQHLRRNLDSALAKAGNLSEPVTVWRGINMGPTADWGQTEADLPQRQADWAENRFKVGAEVQLGGYQSTSFYTDPALDASLGPATSGVIFEIRARRGAYLNSITHYDDEAELLLADNTRYEVVGVQPGVDFEKGDYGDTRQRVVIQLEQLSR